MTRAGAAFVSAAALLAACVDPAPNAGTRSRRDGAVPRGVLATSVNARHPVGALFGDAIELAGYDLEPAVLVPGGTVALTMYWRTIQPVEERYQVFVHLEARGEARLHGDHSPASGAYPTDRWRPGDVVRDRVVIAVPAAYRASAAEAWVGLYTSDEERLPITGAAAGTRRDGERLLLAQVPVAR